MSDVPTSDPGGMTTDTAPVTSAPSTPAAAPDLFVEPVADQAVFDRGYVERLRTEGARYRTEHRDAADQLANYERVFGVYDPEDRQWWMDTAQAWVTDPNEAARRMQAVVQGVLQPETPATPEAETPEPEPAPDLSGLTPQQVQEMIANALSERERAQAEQKAVDEVYSEIRAAGFDPSDKEGFMVLWMANNGGNGDIQQAVKAMAAWKQSIVDEYVSGRSNGHHATPSPNGAVATTQPPVHDLKDARKAAQAFIDAQMGASSG